MKIAGRRRWAASAAREAKQSKENSQSVGKIIKYLKSPHVDVVAVSDKCKNENSSKQMTQK
jgi:hypothetical protein